MRKYFQLTPVAQSMAIIFTGSMVMASSSYASECVSTSGNGVCGLVENDMTLYGNYTPAKAWYFTVPSQNAIIDGNAKAQNLYTAAGGASRGDNDLQSLLVDGAKLDGFYINASKGGSVNITLVNDASVDWLEAGGSTTHSHIIVDHSTLNGADPTKDYDRNTRGKAYAKGYAIYLDSADKGNQEIEITNNSQLNGGIFTGGAGSHNIELTDSEINQGGILIYNGLGDNTVALKNSVIDSRNAANATKTAINLSGLTSSANTNTVQVEQSDLFGTLAVSGSGGTTRVSLDGSSATATTDTNKNALSLINAKQTFLNVNDSTVTGNSDLAGADLISSTFTSSQLSGNLTLRNAKDIQVALADSVVDGNINASAGKGDLALHITDNSLVTGDINLNGTTLQNVSVWLDNAQVQGNLYGNGSSVLNLGASIQQIDGGKFSGFNALNLNGNLVIEGGFSDANVGQQLTVNGGGVVAPVNLTQGNLAFSASKLIADTLTLGDASSLTLNNSVLETHSAQLFTQAASAETASADSLTLSGSRIAFNDSVLALNDSAYRLDYVKSVHDLLAGQNGYSLVMTGTLMDGDQATGTTTLNDAAMTGAVLANVAVTADKNRIQVGGTPSDADSQHVANGFGAAQLQLNGVGNPAVVIEGNQALTLTGALGGPLITSSGVAASNVTVNVNQGMLNLGSMATGATESTLDGVINVESAGVMNVAAGHHTVTGTGVISRGELNVNQNATLTADVAIQDQGQMAVAGTVNAGSLTAGSDARITVGDASAAGVLTADSVDLQGAALFIDPAWQDGATLSDASRVALGGNQVNGRLTAGQNSLLMLGGSDVDSVNRDFAASSLVWGQDATAALAVLAPQTLVAGQGGLRIDGSLTADVPAAQRDATANAAIFGEQSLLMVNSASTTNGNVALTASSGTLSVADSAKLYIADAQANRTYAIADGFTSLDFAGNGWRDANLIANKLLQATLSPTEDGVNITTTAKRASEVLPGVMVRNALDRMMNDNANAVNSPDAGVRMLSRAIEAPSASVSDVVKTLNSAAQLAVAGGVQSSSLAVNKAVNNAIYDRNAAPDLDTAQDAGVWVQALYGNQQSDDFSAGNTRYGYDTDFWGVIVGVDKDYALANGNLRTGVAVNTGKGKTDSDGDFNATRDDFNFTGVSLYQNWRNEAFNLTADVGYSAGSHDLSQHLPGWAGMGGKLKADNVDTSVLTVGLNGEYVIDASVLNIIPHVGARYNQLTTDGFTTRASGGEGVFKTDKTRQDIWQFPVGVRLNKTWAMDSGWALSTDADMSVVFTSGDTEVTSKVRATGIPASDRISAEVMDKTAFEGKLGVKMQKGNMTWGVGYSLDASSHNTGQQVGISYRYTF